eukprot:CAMPEP_0175089170 /NCGR_PEP_ID=MMETSP0086_2-20121207/643_1 /TAXON_ID=136419 /ORGANISM="Unknown Unknown, Strain D1" /LENGTH=796 /DNA_ID=CAMNT_0016361661 /DNA_START=117 /DNA_END=2507 /DNA_ORIENTATION=-
MSQKNNLNVPPGKEGSKLKAGKSMASNTSGHGATKTSNSGKSLKNLSKMSTRPSRRLKSSRSGSSKKKGKKNMARVEDKDGNDVTPKPLNYAHPKMSKKLGSNVDMSVENMAFRSGVGSTASEAGSDLNAGEEGQPRKLQEKKPEPQEEVKVPVHMPEKKKWTTAELEEQINVKITETETMTLLHLPGTRIWGDDEALHDAVDARNEAYEKHLEKVKAEKDMYVRRHAQTFNHSKRDKIVQAAPPKTVQAGAQITTWDIYDSNLTEQRMEEAAKKPNVNVSMIGTVPAAGKGDGAASSTDMSASAKGGQSFLGSSDSSFNAARSLGGGVLEEVDPMEHLSSLASFKTALLTLEQAVIQNELHGQQMLYRDHPEIPVELPISAALGLNNKDGSEITSDTLAIRSTESRETPPHMLKLWSYECALTAGQNVSCLCFNTQNRDLLAAGYGGFQFGNEAEGLILFWSLKNPCHPVKHFKTKFAVTSIDFSTEHPHLLAVGMYDGSMAIYDVRDESDRPALESQHSTGKHSEPIWGVKWVTKEATKGSQRLTSISTDGTVQQWSMKKGLVPHELMQLKRMNNKAQFQGSHMDSISREASGLCFDFPINDGTQYFAGTEDGLIHKCSVSYNEQTLENYYGHTGPVYKVKCNPYNADVFLSCSADWTCALWTQQKPAPVITFQSGHDYITDIAWSPANSCVFGNVSRDARVEVWDLESSPLDPVIQFRGDKDKQYNCVIFAPDAPVIVTGGLDGTIDLYRINGVAVSSEDTGKWNVDKQSERLKECLKQQNKSQGKVEDTASH